MTGQVHLKSFLHATQLASTASWLQSPEGRPRYYTLSPAVVPEPCSMVTGGPENDTLYESYGGDGAGGTVCAVPARVTQDLGRGGDEPCDRLSYPGPGQRGWRGSGQDQEDFSRSRRGDR